MKRRSPAYLVAGCFSMLIALIAGAQAAPADSTSGNVQIAIRVLNFIETLPRAGEVRIGVVYDASEAAEAEAVAAQFSAAPGPGVARLDARLIIPEKLFEAGGRFDILFISPKALNDQDAIRRTVAKYNLPSISTDSTCLERETCLFAVKSEPKTEIQMSSKFAAAAGIKISTVFAMLVRQK